MLTLVRSELLKVRSDRTSWVLLGSTLLYTASILAYHTTNARAALNAPPPAIPAGMTPANADAVRQQWALATDPLGLAGTLYTAGTTLGWLLVMLLGILAASREFRYRTAATTFLIGSRSTVVAAKFAAMAVVAVVFWLVTTALDLLVGVVFLNGQGQGSQLGQGPVVRAILLNLFAYGVWAVLGVGLGLAIRRQTPLIAAALGVYVLGVPLAKALLLAVSLTSNIPWINTASIGLPHTAAEVMITAVGSPLDPRWWAGAVILTGYAAAAFALGFLAGNRRDISPEVFHPARHLLPTGGSEHFARARDAGTTRER